MALTQRNKMDSQSTFLLNPISNTIRKQRILILYPAKQGPRRPQGQKEKDK